MTTFNRSRWWWMAAVAVLAGCSDTDGPAAPSPNLPGLAANSDAKTLHEQLVAQLKAMKEQIKAERAQHHQELKLARRDWTDFKRALESAKKLGLSQPAELLRCEPQPWDGDAEIIGPDGGSIRVGEHEVRIPKGALDHEVLISAEAPVADISVVDLEPHGLVFARPVSLELSYRNCIEPPNWLNLFIVYLGTGDRILDITVSRDKKGLKSVTGELEHFSRYAIAW